MQVLTLESINMVQQQLSSPPSLPATQQFLALLHTIVSQYVACRTTINAATYTVPNNAAAYTIPNNAAAHRIAGTAIW